MPEKPEKVEPDIKVYEHVYTARALAEQTRDWETAAVLSALLRDMMYRMGYR